MHCIVGSNGIELDIDTCISIKKMITNDHSSDLQGHFYHLLGNKDDKWNRMSFYLLYPWHIHMFQQKSLHERSDGIVTN